MCLRSKQSFRFHLAVDPLVPRRALAFIPPSFFASTSVPHSFGKYSFPFRKLHSFRFLQALFLPISMRLFYSLRRVHPIRTKFHQFKQDYLINSMTSLSSMSTKNQIQKRISRDKIMIDKKMFTKIMS